MAETFEQVEMARRIYREKYISCCQKVDNLTAELAKARVKIERLNKKLARGWNNPKYSGTTNASTIDAHKPYKRSQ